MHKVTFFNLGNADCTRIVLANGRRILFDYADTRDPNDPKDRRCDLPTLLREELGGGKFFDVVTFTHLDRDHYHRFSQFFWLEHAAKYQSADRIRAKVIWAPAAMLTETCPENDEACILQAEVRHRFRQGLGIRVFSRPDRLREWCAKNDVDFEARRHLITDAGQVAPEFSINGDGVEFFVLSPFARRLNEREVEDRNIDSIIMQATFEVRAIQTQLLLLSDAPYELIRDIVQVTRDVKDRPHRLAWALAKLPHHCSYLSIGPEKGEDQTKPDPDVDWLYRDARATTRGYLVSTSKPIPSKGTAEDEDPQPPHREAANYYRSVVDDPNRRFLVTMEEPTIISPEPITFEIDSGGATLKRASYTGADRITSSNAPRAG